MRSQGISKIKRQLRKYQKEKLQISKIRFNKGYISISFIEEDILPKSIHDIFGVWIKAVDSCEPTENIPELIVGE